MQGRGGRKRSETAAVPVVAISKPGTNLEAMRTAGAEMCIDRVDDTAEVVRAVDGLAGTRRIVHEAPLPWSGEQIAALRDLGLIVDTYTLLREGPADDRRREANRVGRGVAKGLLGATRLLRRYGESDVVRPVLVGIVESLGHEIAAVMGEMAEAPQLRAAA